MRKEYRIIVKNDAKIEIYNDIILAKNENDAMIEFLQNNVIYERDTITIEEE